MDNALCCYNCGTYFREEKPSAPPVSIQNKPAYQQPLPNVQKADNAGVVPERQNRNPSYSEFPENTPDKPAYQQPLPPVQKADNAGGKHKKQNRNTSYSEFPENIPDEPAYQQPDTNRQKEGPNKLGPEIQLQNIGTQANPSAFRQAYMSDLNESYNDFNNPGRRPDINMPPQNQYNNQPPYSQEKKKLNVFSILGFIFSVIFFAASFALSATPYIFYILLGDIIAVVCSIVGLTQCAKDKGRGMGLAIAGLSIGVIAMTKLLFVLWLSFTFPIYL